MKIQKRSFTSMKSLSLYIITFIYAINTFGQTSYTATNPSGNATFNANSTNGDSQYNASSTTGNASVNLTASGTKANNIHFMNGTGRTWQLSGPNNDGLYSLAFNHYNGSSWITAPLFLTTGGKVGVGGNVTPNGVLSFPNGFLNRKIVLDDGSNSDHQFLGLGISDGGSGAKLFRYQVNSSIDAHVFYSGNSITTSNELMRITGSGNVGIGVSAPHGSLQFPIGYKARKIVLFESADNDHQFYGFGNSTGSVSVLRYQIPTNSSSYAHVFYAGNGTAGSDELLRVQGDGNVGIGLTGTAAAKLHLNGGPVLFNGAYTGTTGGTPVAGVGTRMMWIPARGAFRAGQVSSTQWDDSNIGNYSAAFGYDNIASGGNAFVGGTGNSATASSATAFGYSNSVSGGGSFASGGGNIVSGAHSFVFGYGNQALSNNSLAIGYYTKIGSSATYSGVIGSGIDAGNMLQNNISQSLMIGYNSNIPTLFVSSSSGLGTTGAVAIATTTIPAATAAPTSTGYKLIVGGHSYLNGSVVIGDQASINQATKYPAGYSLYVTEGILAKKVKVALPTTAAWADYVFDEKYKLMPLDSVASYVKENKHLPNIPSAEEAKNNGVDLLEMDAKLLQKVEELTLYMIEQKKELELLKKENKELSKKVEKLSKKRR